MRTRQEQQQQQSETEPAPHNMVCLLRYDELADGVIVDTVDQAAFMDMHSVIRRTMGPRLEDVFAPSLRDRKYTYEAMRMTGGRYETAIQIPQAIGLGDLLYRHRSWQQAWDFHGVIVEILSSPENVRHIKRQRRLASRKNLLYEMALYAVVE